MTLGENDRRLYARHILLPEIGLSGQARLLATPFTLRPGDPRATCVARTYLLRAGALLPKGTRPTEAIDVAVPSEERVERLARDPALREAAAAIAGAFAAAEAIKRAVGAGTPAELPEVTL